MPQHLYPSFKWRVLMPTLGLMWGAIIFLAFYQWGRENNIRRLTMQRQLTHVSNSALQACESGADMTEYLEFLDLYFGQTGYDGVRVSVYTADGRLIASTGAPVPFGAKDDPSKISEPDLDGDGGARGNRAFADDMFYYMAQQSVDGKRYVLTALPYTAKISDALERRNHIWWVIVPMLIVSTAVVWLYVKHLSRSVTQLALFADNAARGVRGHYSFPRDEIGRISERIVELYRDRTNAIAKTREEHEIAINAIKEKSRLKKEMSSNISHELKTPLSIIKGYVDTILASPEMDAETMRRFITRASTNIERLNELINSLSMVNRLEDGAQQIAISEVDMHDLVFYIDDDVTQSGVLHGMNFTYDIPLNTRVKGNLDLLSGMILNLLKNSVRHSQGKNIRLELANKGDKFYTFRFYDDGIGVPEESIGRLFDRFYRVDKGRSRKSGDSGLGLPIVYNTVTALGGIISVKNRSTGGLEFVFTLPIWE